MKLFQRCPVCDREEAAGPYCTGCHRLTPPAEWYAHAMTGRPQIGPPRRPPARIAHAAIPGGKGPR